MTDSISQLLMCDLCKVMQTSVVGWIPLHKWKTAKMDWLSSEKIPQMKDIDV